MDVKINGVLIKSYSCGSIGQNSPKRVTLTGSYTAVGAGPHKIEIYNYRNYYQTQCYNYFDNISLEPVDADLFIDYGNVSMQSGRLVKIELDAGPSHGGETYFVLASFATHPGITVDGVHIPLVWDSVFNVSRNNYNGNIFIDTFGTLNAQGQASAWFSVSGPVAPQYLGSQVYFSYALLTGAGQRPVTYASYPAMVSFVP